MKKSILLCVLGILCALPCAPQTTVNKETLRQKADLLAHKFIIADGHVDLPYRLKTRNFRLVKEYLGIPIESENGDFDFVRARKGGLDAPFMSIYIPAEYQQTGGARALADSLIDMIEGIAKSHPKNFAVASTPKAIRKNFKKGIISLPLGIENGAAIEDDLDNLAHFHQRGVRYITLTHGKVNLICDSSYDPIRKWNGLSDFGREVVKEMNRLGIMIDISHVSDSTFYQVARLSKAPIIASHSSSRHYTPDWERNMSDAMISRLGEVGGIIMINFGSDFLDKKVTTYNTQKKEELEALLNKKGLTDVDEAAKPIIEQFRKDNPNLYSDVEQVADHIDRVVQLAGIDHVGLGSDYDGVGDSLPTGLKDVSQYPNLIYELLKRGYSKEAIEKICYKNIFRVWNTVEKTAKKLRK